MNCLQESKQKIVANNWDNFGIFLFIKQKTCIIMGPKTPQSKSWFMSQFPDPDDSQGAPLQIKIYQHQDWIFFNLRDLPK